MAETTNNVTKLEFIEELALSDDIESKAAAARILDRVTQLIRDNAVAGKTTHLGQNFGSFVVATQAARSGTVNGKTYSTPAKQVIKFKSSTPLKAEVAGA